MVGEASSARFRRRMRMWIRGMRKSRNKGERERARRRETERARETKQRKSKGGR